MVRHLSKVLTIVIAVSLIFACSEFAGTISKVKGDVTTGLVGWWKFDEGTGQYAYDSSGNGNTGTLANGPTWTGGKIDGALSFDGTDDHVQISDSNSLDLTGALTIAMWFKPAITITPENPWFYSLLMKWHGIGDQWRTGYGIQIKEGGRVGILRGYGSGEAGGIGGANHTWNADQWYHVAITYDTSLPSGNGKIYVDCVLEAQDDETRPIAANTLSLCINNDPFELWHPQVKFFPGVIDDVRIYNRALSEEEIRELAQVVDWWPMFGHDPGHTGYSTSKAPNSNGTLWTFEADSQWITGPSVVNGRAFCGAGNGKIYAINEYNGALLWNYTTTGSTGIPAVSEGTVFAPSNDNTLYALNESNGALIWSFVLGGDVVSPTVADGIVFATTGRSWEVSGRLYALNKTNGDLIWNYSSSDGFCNPTVANGMVFSADCDGGRVYAFDEFTGSVKWNYTIGTYIDDAPSVANGVVYIGAWDGLLYALNETTGNLLWNSSAGPWGAAVAIAHNRVIYSFEGGTEIRALDAVSGSFIWSFFAGDRLSRLALADGKVFAASKDQKVYALNESTGLLIWSYDTGVITNEAACVPSVADGILFVGSMTEYGVPAKLFAFGPEFEHDVAISNVSTSKSGCLPKPIVCQGYTARVYMTVVNEGTYTETFNVTAYATNSTDSYEIGRVQVGLNQGESVNLTLVWNTSGFAKGNYTISAVADTVPGEVHTEDNVFIGDTLEIVLAGDVCPTDGYVGIDDIFNIATHFGRERGDPGYDPNKDITDDDYLGIDDIFIAASHFGQEDP